MENQEAKAVKIQCVHQWIYQHAKIDGSIYCIRCGAEPVYSFLAIRPTGEVMQVQDPGDEAGRVSVIEGMIGKASEQILVADYPFEVYAIAPIGKQTENQLTLRGPLLSEIPGPALLLPGTPLGGGEYFDEGRGFGRLELSVVRDMLVNGPLPVARFPPGIK
jgi:hypothetical protein